MSSEAIDLCHAPYYSKIYLVITLHCSYVYELRTNEINSQKHEEEKKQKRKNTETKGLVLDTMYIRVMESVHFTCVKLK